VSRQVRTRAMLAHLPTSARRQVYSCPRQPVAEGAQLAFDSATQVQAHRTAGRRERCEALERAVHPLSASTAGSMANDRSWFDRRVAASASLYRRPSDKCLPRAPILPYFPCSPSVTRFGAYPAPGGTAGSAFSGLLPQPGALGPRSRKCTLGTWERGTLPPHHTQIVCWGLRDLASLRARVSRG
jgi:hypothetical protein